MTTRTQIGDVLTESCGDELTVYIHQYADEEHHEIEIDGRACSISFDPSAPNGRTGLRALIARLQEALDTHAAHCEKIYGDLKVGDWCVEVREPVGDEPRCQHTAGQVDVLAFRCSRVAHDDYHHVAVDDGYNVLAVRHATDRILPTGVPWSVA